MKHIFLLLILLILTGIFGADQIILHGDRVLEGLVIAGEDSYHLITPYAVITVDTAQVKEIRKGPDTEKTIDTILSRLIEKEEYRGALQFIQRCHEENIFGVAEYYRRTNAVQKVKNEHRFEKEIDELYNNEDYQQLINLFETHLAAYPEYRLTDSQKQKLISAYTQMSFYYIDHIQYEKGYGYLYKAFQLGKDSPAVREILILYAERTGNEFIIEQEKKQDQLLAERRPLVRPVYPEEKVAQPHQTVEISGKSDEDLMLLLLQAYNAGPATLLAYGGNVQYRETQEYVRKVKQHLESPTLNTPHDKHIYRHAEKYKLDPQFVKAVLLAESSGRAQAVSSQGARGVMQIMQGTWSDMTKYIGVQWPYQEAFEPDKNIEIGCAYFAWLRDDFLPLFFSLP